MSKIKFTILGLLVLATCTIASATASAAKNDFLVNGAEVTENQEIVSDNTAANFSSTMAGSSISIECVQDESAKSVIKAAGKSEAETELKGCSLFALNKGKEETLTTCKVSEPVTAKITGELVAAGEDKLVGSGEKEGVAEIKLEKINKESVCAVEATLKLAGLEVCAIPHPENEEYVHDFACSPGGGGLKLGTEPAQLYDTELVTLKKGGKFSSAAAHFGFEADKGWSAEGKGGGEFLINEETKVTCEKETFEGVSPLTGFSEKLDMAPKYSGCQLEITKESKTTKTTAKVESGGCDYELLNEEEPGKDKFKSDFDISNCTGGEKGGIKITDSELEEKKTCTITIPDQADGEEDEDTDMKEGKEPFESEANVDVTDGSSESSECPATVEEGKEPQHHHHHCHLLVRLILLLLSFISSFF